MRRRATGGSEIIDGKPPKVRNTGEPNIAVAGEYTSGDATGDTVETFCESGGEIGMPVAVRIDQQADALGFHLEIAPVQDTIMIQIGEEAAFHPGELVELGLIGGGERSAKEIGALFHRAYGEIALEPFRKIADIEDGSSAAIRFNDIATALLVEREANDILHHRLGGKQIDLESGCGVEQPHGGGGVLARAGGVGFWRVEFRGLERQ